MISKLQASRLIPENLNIFIYFHLSSLSQLIVFALEAFSVA